MTHRPKPWAEAMAKSEIKEPLSIASAQGFGRWVMVMKTVINYYNSNLGFLLLNDFFCMWP